MTLDDRSDPPPSQPASDLQVVDDLLAGDRDAYRLVRRWIRGSLGPYRQRLARDAEDLEQETMLELTKALREQRFDGRSSLRVYVRAMVHHKCLDRLRAASRRQWVDLDDLPSDRVESPEPSASRRLESSQVASRVMSDLGEDCRRLLLMVASGMRYREIADATGLAEGTLRVRVKRCRDRALEARRRLLDG